jgi:hypothetical protein
MPEEYRMNLELAKGAMARISLADTRKHAETLIDGAPHSRCKSHAISQKYAPQG